ncbi:polysaccharide deacetylase [Carbonactinospora thermoautotrophica]|uniref:Polysaccharide deacetylase n=1 Tax=Carbonactinospora thermoautotrophica TaxID=1469144 RepID=A0A132N568_9ACTN|nr:polysaccharide deacetylase [Carbonactinospora thermoautotrophica]KWX07332.1 polysaccharide deacetylase [Carbonactinospora thermoautotrophica]
MVYLTFDDGPHPRWTPQILQVLDQYRAHATFFVIGQQADRYGALVRREHAAGHGIGNHTWSHRPLQGVSYARFRQEVLRTQQVLGPLGSHCLRPPYGAMDSHTRQYAESLGFQVVLWTIDTRDWQRPGASVIVQSVLSRVRPRSIIVFHDAGGDRAQTVAALRTILPRLRAAGYEMVPICR